MSQMRELVGDTTSRLCPHCGYYMPIEPGICAKCGNITRADSPPKFQMNDRVRVKVGADRGHYGTIIHVGGDCADYFGVKLDCHDKEMGYCGYELE